MAAPESGFDVNDPANISPLVVWLGGADSARRDRAACSRSRAARSPRRRRLAARPACRSAARSKSKPRSGPQCCDLIAKAPTPAPVYGRAMTALAPGAARGASRVGAGLGVWTDETLLDRLASVDGDERRLIVDGDVAHARSPDLRAIGAPHFRCTSWACVPATSSRGNSQVVGRRGAVLGRVAVQHSRARSRRACAPREVGFILRRRATRAWPSCRTSSAAQTTARRSSKRPASSAP